MFTTEEARAEGVTMAALKWGERSGRWHRVRKGVYRQGPDAPDELDLLVARVIATGGVASGTLAGVLHGLDGVVLDTRPLRRRSLPPGRVGERDGIRCTDALQTMVDLAASLDDSAWEQALESALRKRLTTVEELEGALPALARSRMPGTSRIRRVLARRPYDAPPTESLLETLLVQLARTVPDLDDPVRQLQIDDMHECFVARVDLAWPDLGLFVELDGEHHKHQPVHDARRETAVVAATGWLCGRFTWTEVVRTPKSTARRVASLAEQARRRPQASGAPPTGFVRS